MKRLWLFLFFGFSLHAHHPILNYLQIKQWCDTINNLQQSDLLLWQNYLVLGKEFAEMCTKNTYCATTDEGKALQKRIDDAVHKIFQQSSLQKIFRTFVDLVKAELALNQENEYTGQHQVKINFKVLALVCEGCLQCVNERLQLKG